MRKTMLDSTTGLFTDTAHGNHSAWHSQVFSLWAGVAPAENWHRMMTFLASKAVDTGVTGSVYAAYAYFLSLYEADFDHGNLALKMLTSFAHSFRWTNASPTRSGKCARLHSRLLPRSCAIRALILPLLLLRTVMLSLQPLQRRVTRPPLQLAALLPRPCLAAPTCQFLS